MLGKDILHLLTGQSMTSCLQYHSKATIALAFSIVSKTDCRQALNSFQAERLPSNWFLITSGKVF